MKTKQSRAVVTEETAGKAWTVRVGSVSVRVNASVNRGAPVFALSFYGPEGKRRQEMRRTLQDALERAEQLAGYVAKGQPVNASLSAHAGLVYTRAEAVLAPLNMPVDVAALRLADFQRQLGDRTIEEAIACFKSHTPAAGSASNTVEQTRTAFLAARKADGCGPEHLRDLSIRTKRFAGAFQCPLSNVTTQAISEWLRGLGLSGRSRNNFRDALRNMFRFAAAQNWIAKDAINWDADNGVATAKEETGAIEIYSPEEIRQLIAAARYENPAPTTRRVYIEAQGLLPFLVLGAFAGLRTSEIQGQLWSDIDLERGFIRVSKVKGNTPAKRLVPLTEACRAWLAVCPRNGANVCTHSRLDGAIRELAERAKLTWKKNALRHSFISYRVAETQNVAQVAIEAGNSPRMIFANYRELVTPEQAKAWFALRP